MADTTWGKSVDGLFGISQRLPPSNIHAEQALLGALLSNNKAFDRVADFLLPEHFADPVNGKIYEAIRRRVLSGRIADGITIGADLENSTALADVGPGYIAQLLTAMVAIINAGEYGTAIRDAWHRRQMIDIGEQLVNAAFAPEGADAAAIQAAAEARLDLLQDRGGRRSLVTMNDALDAAIMAADEARLRGGVIGLSTGMASVDRAIGGLQRQTMTLLAGRPGMGKSSLGMTWAVNAGLHARDNPGTGGVFVGSLEMSAEGLAQRTLADHARVAASRMRDGKHGDYTHQISLARQELDDVPLVIDDNGASSIASIRSSARQAARRFGHLALIMIDHLHIIAPDDRGGRNDNRTSEMGRISAGCKAMAKEFDCPVLALAQLSRKLEERDDKRPTLTDLRDSGTLEQDADTVAFIHRPEYYLPLTPPDRKSTEPQAAYSARVIDFDEQRANLHGKAELIFDKVRGGAKATVPLKFCEDTIHFEDLA